MSSHLILNKGHIRSLWMICFPLMLSALSGTLMHFIDRLILAKYDTHAMIAATTSSNIAFIFQFGALSIAMIAEVFVGQFYGAGNHKAVARPVWQMIWFALFCGLLFIPIGLFADSLFLSPELITHGAPNFRWLMLLGISYPLVGALTAFFVGRGEVKPVLISVVLANALNLILIVPFVFGLGIIPEMGAKGAAMATGIAEMSAAVLLFYLFLRPKNRQQFETHRWHFDKTLFIQCFKVGIPNTIGHMTSYTAWAMVLFLLAKRGIAHVTVVSIGLILWSLFSFITEGLQKGVTALAANCIGAKKIELLPSILKSGLKLQFLLALVLALPLVVYPEIMVDLFIPIHGDVNEVAHLRELVIISCRWLWLAYLFDGMAWVIDGILTAAQDTQFIMIMNSFGTWIFCVVPIYYFIVLKEGSPIQTLQLISAFCILLFLSYFFRYKSRCLLTSISPFCKAQTVS